MVQLKSLSKSFNYKNNPMVMDNLPRERNLRKSDLGGVIFGCKHDTFVECHSKQLFGLPSQHFIYVRNIEGGLPLFLFNYSDRKMHGLYEAVGTGQLNIDPYAWTDQGSEKTPFPAQVLIRIKASCYPLEENEFKKAIYDNYYDKFKFWFELDHAQTRALTSLFKKCASPTNFRTLPVIISLAEAVRKPVKAESSKNLKFKQVELDSIQTEEDAVSDWEVLAEDNSSNSNYSNLSSNDEAEKERILGILNQIKESRERLKKSNSEEVKGADLKNSKENCDFKKDKGVSANSSSQHDELLKSINELSVRMILLERNQATKDREMEQLKETIDQSELRINRLKTQILKLESKSKPSSSSSSSSISPPDCENSLRHFVEQCQSTEDAIYLLGGNNGFSFLSNFESFSPSLDILTPLRPMSCAKSYMAVATLDGRIFTVGGYDGDSWFNTVECYDRRNDEWAPQGSLNREKGCLAAVSLNGKIYAIGGKDQSEYFSVVEMLDPALGKWITFIPMLQKRSSFGAAALNGAIYAAGGYNGDKYLCSGERLDMREPYWKKIPNMNTRRGTHFLTVFNNKIYTVGGYDGSSTVASVEWLDPRMPLWVIAEPIRYGRGYVATCVVGNSLYTIGGTINNNDTVVDIVECYQEGRGWINTGLKAIGKRCCNAITF